MSFRLFIYYCALSGAWAAFATWALTVLLLSGGMSITSRATLIGAILGALVGAAIGLVDAIHSAIGMQRVGQVFVAMFFGLVGGALGGLVGQLLKTYLAVPVLVGWMLAGVLIGAGIGIYDVLQAAGAGREVRSALRKTINGVYGGLLGGFLGGLPSWLLENTTSLPRSAALIGLVLLGGSIGLMIGLAQVVLKEAWIKVVEGFRTGRELILTQTETTIGRSETCHLGLYADTSVDRVHARILLKGNRYLLQHTGENGETLLNDRAVSREPEPLRSGDLIRLGKSLLRFGERQKRGRRTAG